MGTDPANRQRTREIAVAEVRFAVEYGVLNERFWQRIDTTMNIVQIVAGALALAGVWKSSLSAAGIVVALISALQLTLQPTRRSIDFRDARRRFADLNRRAPAMQLGEIDDELESLRSEAPQGALRALEMPALNIVNAQHGHASARELTVREKIALAFA